MDTISGKLHQIAVDTCTKLCKYHAEYVAKYEGYDEDGYERLCIEHCEECPLNELGVWNEYE